MARTIFDEQVCCCDICNNSYRSPITGLVQVQDNLCSNCRMRVDELGGQSKLAILRFLDGNVL